MTSRDLETFELFSQLLPSLGLGMLEPKSETLELSVGNQDFSITQSPGVLQSNREGGTTGAIVWQASIRFAEWLARSENFLFDRGVLNSESIALELGSGVSGVVPMVLRPRIRRFIATDQPYILRKLGENISSNAATWSRSIKRKPTVPSKGSSNEDKQSLIKTVPLDWETDDVPQMLKTQGLKSGVDLVVACDCIFNYPLINPFVQTCMDISQVRETCETENQQACTQTIFVVAQQLRQPDVFAQWLEAFQKLFRVWRIPDELLTEGLKEGSGFAVHLGVLKAAV